MEGEEAEGAFKGGPKLSVGLGDKEGYERVSDTAKRGTSVN